MRIGINARLLHSPALRGWNRYAVNLLAELQSCGVETVLYSDRPLHESHLRRMRPESCSTRVSPPMKYAWWEQVWLPRQCRADGIHVLHSPFHFGLPFHTHCPRVITLHDAIETMYYRSKASVRLGDMLNALSHWIGRSRAHGVITVSEFSKQDIVNSLSVDPERISVIYEAADPAFDNPVLPSERAGVRRRHQLPDRYFFYVGGWERRKNLPFLVRAFAEASLADVHLVFAGGGTEASDLLGIAEQAGVKDRLRLLGSVSDDDLPALYAEALAFVYPSEYEGFGLQLCEAMRVGCPVLAARATSLPEILGDGGETFSLEDTQELAAQLRSVATDTAYRNNLIYSAIQRSRKFDWRRTALETIAVYERLGNS